MVGWHDGSIVGDVGSNDGDADGTTVGDMLGGKVGLNDGNIVGINVG